MKSADANRMLLFLGAASGFVIFALLIYWLDPKFLGLVAALAALCLGMLVVIWATSRRSGEERNTGSED